MIALCFSSLSLSTTVAATTTTSRDDFHEKAWGTTVGLHKEQTVQLKCFLQSQCMHKVWCAGHALRYMYKTKSYAGKMEPQSIISAALYQ